ncbi:unnamed protein product [Prorocentrum cordatum]|uniref:Uncharacterized protein n=1 Tax=Prorocentrum cordatum TaxID=2364126 RepID=A0ABN9Q1Z0_9DINO|nr:unnamed protein product [Polarella glacialis]
MQALQNPERPCLLGKVIQQTKAASNGNHSGYCGLDDDSDVTGATTVCASTSDLTHAARGMSTDARRQEGAEAELLRRTLRRQALARRWRAYQELSEAHPALLCADAKCKHSGHGGLDDGSDVTGATTELLRRTRRKALARLWLAYQELAEAQTLFFACRMDDDGDDDDSEFDLAAAASALRCAEQPAAGAARRGPAATVVSL